MLMFSISLFSLAFFLIDSFLVKLDFKWHSLGYFILPEEVVNRWGRVAPRVDCARENEGRNSDNGSELRSNSATKWVARFEALRKEWYIRGKYTSLKTLGVR